MTRRNQSSFFIGQSTTAAREVVQLGLDIMRFSQILSPFTSGTTRGISGFERKALDLSTLTIHCSAARGHHSRDTSALAAKNKPSSHHIPSSESN
jgi:hypothetical protein